MDAIGARICDELINQGKTYKEISEELKENFPNKRGFSVRSVKRYCAAHNLSTRVQTEFIKNEVVKAIEEVIHFHLPSRNYRCIISKHF